MEFAERLRTHGEPRQLVCVPIPRDGSADMVLIRGFSAFDGQ